MLDEVKGINARRKMRTAAEKIALFDRYLRNEMPSDERLIVEAELKENQELRKDFEAFKALEHGLENQEIIAFKAKLNDWDKAGKQPTENKGVFSMRFLAIAASIVLLVGVGATFLLLSTPSNQTLVADNFNPYDNVLTVRGEKEDMDEGLKFYEQQQYEKAIENFEKYSTNENAVFYLAECYMALERYAEAIPLFEKVVVFDNVFSEVALFHLSLAELGNNNKKKALKHLKSIPSSSDYADEAALLIEDLD